MQRQEASLHTGKVRMLHRMQKGEAKRMESTTRRGIALKLRLLYHVNHIARGYQRTRRKNRIKMGRKPKRDSYKRAKIILRTLPERHIEKHKALVCHGTRRKKRPDTPTWYIFWPKKRGTDKKTLEIRILIHRPIL